MRTAFDLLDRDQDGMVTPTELQFMLRNLGIEMSDAIIDGLMKEASKTGEFRSSFFGFANQQVALEIEKLSIAFSSHSKSKFCHVFQALLLSLWAFYIEQLKRERGESGSTV